MFSTSDLVRKQMDDTALSRRSVRKVKDQKTKKAAVGGWVMHIVQPQFPVVVISANGPERVASIASTGVGAREKSSSIER